MCLHNKLLFLHGLFLKFLPKQPHRSLPFPALSGTPIGMQRFEGEQILKQAAGGHPIHVTIYGFHSQKGAYPHTQCILVLSWSPRRGAHGTGHQLQPRAGPALHTLSTWLHLPKSKAVGYTMLLHPHFPQGPHFSAPGIPPSSSCTHSPIFHGKISPVPSLSNVMTFSSTFQSCALWTVDWNCLFVLLSLPFPSQVFFNTDVQDIPQTQLKAVLQDMLCMVVLQP